MQRAVREGKRQGVSTTTVADLATVLDTTPGWLLEQTGPAPRPPRRDPEFHRFEGTIPDPASMPRDLPIYGAATAGPVGKAGSFSLDRSKAVGFARRFPVLAGESEAYAFYVPEDSMAPMHSPGDLRVAHPHRPVRRGDSVLLLMEQGEGKPPRAMIKIYLGEEGDHVVLTQLNPKATIRLRKALVTVIDHIMSQNELFEA
jgi:phage repressor protein C with HTH and peptisase S24 domain